MVKRTLKRFFPLLCCMALLVSLIVPAAAIDVEPNVVVAYTTTISLDGEIFTFFGDTNSSPSVSMVITATGGQLTAGSVSYTYTYSGEGTFLGFAYSSDATSPIFEVDSNVNFPGGSGSNSSYSLYSVAKDDDGSTIITRLIKGGVWRVRTDGAGNLVVPSSWPDNLLFESLEFLSGDFQFKSMSIGSSDCLLYCQSSFGTNAVIAYDPFVLPDSWVPDLTTIMIQGDQNVSVPFYNWFVTVFDYVSDDTDPGTYYTLVQVHNYRGTQINHQFQYFSDGTSPRLKILFTELGFQIFLGEELLDHLVLDDPERGFGFSDAPLMHDSKYLPGSWVYIGGTAENATLDLYFTFTPEFADPSDIDVGGFLTNVIGGFFGFELFPGLSLSDLLWVTISIGLLFAFLKLFT